MEFVISRINEIFFSLRFAVIAVGHHQIPMHFFLYHIIGNRKGILTFSYVFDNGCVYAAFFGHFPQCSLFILFSCLYCSFRKHPAIILILIAFIKSKYFASINYHPATAHCFYHCQSSCFALCITKASIPFFCARCNNGFVTFYSKYASKAFFAAGTAYLLPAPEASTITLTAIFLPSFSAYPTNQECGFP